MKSATQLTDASASLHSVDDEVELMEWHDAWMSSDEYIAMSDSEAVMLEALFQDRSLTFARKAAQMLAVGPRLEPGNGCHLLRVPSRLNAPWFAVMISVVD